MPLSFSIQLSARLQDTYDPLGKFYSMKALKHDTTISAREQFSSKITLHTTIKCAYI